jgi:hypothetical protein
VNTRRMALACVLMCAVVVVLFWIVVRSSVVASLSVTTGSGDGVTCAVHRERAGYSIRTQGQGSLWSHGGSSYVRIDSDASREDVRIDYDSKAEEFVVTIGKQRVRVEANRSVRIDGNR